MNTPSLTNQRNNTQTRIVAAISSGAATTRAEIARVLGLSPSTVSGHVQSLLDQKILTETGAATSQGGRRATLLTVQTQAQPIVVELGAEHVHGAVGDTIGNIGRTCEAPIDLLAGPAPTIERLVHFIQETAHEHQLSDIKGVALSIPGPVDFEAGTVRNPSRMPGWDQYPIRDELERLLGVPVVIENDANLTALGEHFLAEDIHTSICVKAGTGIGAGLVLNDELYRGANSFAGDLSHARISDEADEPCACGNRGCLEATASGAAIVTQLQKLGYSIETTADVLNLVANGDAQATACVRDAGRSLGAMLCPIVGFVNPDAVFLGGALSTLDIFATAVKGQLYDRCHPLATMNLQIRQARSGKNVALIGASKLLLRELGCLS